MPCSPDPRRNWSSENTRQSFAIGEQSAMIDSFGRQIHYLRLSVRDRCNLRCGYCMGAHTTFAATDDLLTFEELERLCATFLGLGMRKLRLTGGEPLVSPHCGGGQGHGAGARRGRGKCVDIFGRWHDTLEQ